jgi:glycosyltransferase involved in cell wall biosynthesis
MKVALVYDRLNKWGGAERVLLALHEIFPDAPLYTSVYSPENASFAKVFDVKTSFLQKYRSLRSHNEMLALFMPLAFESFNFDDFDLVISVTSESAKGILTKPKTRHICYCLTPTRYLWSGYDEYFRGEVMKFISTPALKYLKRWDRVASKRPDSMIAISTEVQSRIKNYYGRDSEIIFPPIMIEKKNLKSESREKYFLMVSRLSRSTHYKKVDLAIEAFNKTNYNLKIIGTGPLRSKFEKKANKNIKFLGKLTDEKLAYYYQNSQALVFPGLEDFGLVMAESQFFGKPVIAFSGGGAKDIVKDNKTGLLFKEQNAQSLLEALKSFHESDYNRQDILKSAERFSFENFKTNLERQISVVYK